MSSTRRRVGIVAAWAVAATVGLAAITGAAASIASAEATPSPSTSASEKPDQNDRKRDGRHARRVLAKRVLHGEAVVKKKEGGFVTIVRQRGTVTAVDADSVTIRSEDGYSATYTLNGDTNVRVDRKEGKVSDLKNGQNVGLVAVKEGGTVTARMVTVRTRD
ncbi:MAG TPA: hypothetical protein VGR21_04830 [Cryptosporangiaceae bacterium]|nr:hypothetical protein [Cryptosporangiaceae bacterium]